MLAGSRSLHSATGFVTCVLWIAIAGCRSDSPLSTTDEKNVHLSHTPAVVCPISSSGPDVGEGEFFGDVFINGARRCSAVEDQVKLIPDAATEARRPGLKHTLLVHDNYPRMFEWWDSTAADGPCRSGTTPEVAHSSTGGTEGHCIIPGRYTLTIDEFPSMPVDYLSLTDNRLSDGGYIESTTYGRVKYLDLVVNRDARDTLPPATEVDSIEVDTATNAYSSGYHPFPMTSATVTQTDAGRWLRFRVSASTSSWTGATMGHTGDALARLYFNGSDTSQATGYYSYSTEGNSYAIRIHRYPNPVTAFRDYQVGLEILRPDENPQNTPTVTRTVRITRIAPDLVPAIISTPASAQAGSSITLKFSARNGATNPVGVAEANWHGVVHYRTAPGVVPARDTALGFTESHSIAAQGADTFTVALGIPSDWPVGQDSIELTLDDGARILEGDETNNFIAVALPIAPKACDSFEGKTTWRFSSQIFSATCSTQGPTISYRWRTDTDSAFSAYSPSPLFAFNGHASAGTHIITLNVIDSRTNLTGVKVDTFTVQASTLAVTGPNVISVKGTYAYSTSGSSAWTVKFPPNQSWTSAGTGASITHTWPLGCQLVYLRADQSSGGVLKRGTLEITLNGQAGCTLTAPGN